jgi:(E)-4-hydroxy-3-methylbut-2-enyl-diphosphate synthase
MRFKTRVIQVGKVLVGGDNPIRIQSMTTSNTRDIQSTVEQIIRLSDVGCEIVRVTVQGKKEAEACEHIKNRLIQLGYDIPIVADIHFYPPAALLVADFVDKIRINPGNYVDRRAMFKTIHYDDNSYAIELERIEEGFYPLVEKCKKRGLAMRIGTNHGSLSDRIMNRYGDTSLGMIESALEFARICRKYDYHNFLFSMKSSNPLIMMDAYRGLVNEMEKLAWDYPLHLGVTEAGDGEDGRVKSSVGIGTLLLEGLGDTIRMSLTEDPWAEIEPSKRLIRATEKSRKIEQINLAFPDGWIDGVVVLSVNEEQILHPDFYKHIGCKIELGKCFKQDNTVDAIFIEGEISLFAQNKLEKLQEAGIIVNVKEGNGPVILKGQYNLTQEDLVIQAATDFGSLLSNKIGDGIWIEGPYSIESLRSLSFSILQAVRKRRSKTEFIACPGCGRTLFDIQSVTKTIRSKTDHLPDVKIAIMGCIVNGPGEMADADFGYVGSKKNKIDLYIGKECVERDIDATDALEKLIQLIKDEGRWIEPSDSSFIS